MVHVYTGTNKKIFTGIERKSLVELQIAEFQRLNQGIDRLANIIVVKFVRQFTIRSVGTKAVSGLVIIEIGPVAGKKDTVVRGIHIIFQRDGELPLGRIGGDGLEGGEFGFRQLKSPLNGGAIYKPGTWCRPQNGSNEYRSIFFCFLLFEIEPPPDVIRH